MRNLCNKLPLNGLSSNLRGSTVKNLFIALVALFVMNATLTITTAIAQDETPLSVESSLKLQQHEQRCRALMMQFIQGRAEQAMFVGTSASDVESLRNATQTFLVASQLMLEENCLDKQIDDQVKQEIRERIQRR